MGLTLHDLPFELLTSIHLLSLSPSLPVLNRHFHALFSSTSSAYKATYLLRCTPAKKTLFYSLKYPLSRSLPVFQELERRIRLRKAKAKKHRKRATTDEGPPVPILTLHDLPRSFLSSYTSSRLPLLLYIFSNYSQTLSRDFPHSSPGYFLSLACLRRDWVLVELLSYFEADTTLKNGAAIVAVIEGCSRLEGESGESVALEWVKRLSLEYAQNARSDELLGDLGLPDYKVGEEVERETVGMRASPSTEVLEKAVEKKMWKVVDWLVEMGAKPSLEVLRMLG